jgi:hypothetical protein
MRQNREVFLAGKLKEDRIRLAHQHFTAAQAIRPDNVTNFYRRGMLLKQIEKEPKKAILRGAGIDPVTYN